MREVLTHTLAERRSRREDWTYACGRVAALEGDLLSRGFFEELMACSDATSARAVLSRSRYRDLFPNDEAVARYDEALAAFADRFRSGLLAAAPPHPVGEFLELPARYRLFRGQFMRRAAQGAAADEIEGAFRTLAAYSAQWDALAEHRAMVHGKDAPQGADPVARSLFLDSAGCTAAWALAQVASEPDAARTMSDWAILKAWAAALRAAWNGASAEVLSRWFRLPGALEGFAAATARAAEADPSAPAREHLSPGAAEILRGMSPARIREDIDGAAAVALTEDVAACRRVVFGPERVLAYLLACTKEMANLRLCLAAVVHGIAREAVAARLGLGYA